MTADIKRKELEKLRKEAEAALGKRAAEKITVIIGMGTCGIAAGAREVQEAVLEELEALEIDAEVIGVGCIGMCHNEPLLDIQQPGRSRVTYAKVSPKKARQILKQHLVEGKINKRWAYAQLPGEGDELEERIPTYEELPFYDKQVRIALKNCGIINPESIDEYLAWGGYKGLSRALFEMEPQDVIEEVKDS